MYPSHSKPGFAELKTPHLAVLSTLLDAHLLFEEPAISKNVFQEYFELIWPQISLGKCLEELCGKGFVETARAADYVVPEDRRRELALRLEKDFFLQPIRLPGNTLSHETLMKGFLDFAHGEQQDLAEAEIEMKKWGGWAYTSSDRVHHILFRSHPLRLKAHPKEFLLICTRLSQELNRPLSEDFVRNPSAQQRLAFFDLERTQKMNLTKSPVVFYFERYLKRAFGVRMGSTTIFNQSLEDAGLLSLRMG